MKTKTKFLIIAIAIFFVVLSFNGYTAFADESEELNQNITTILDGLDLSELENYLAEHQSDFLFNFGDTAREIIEYLVKGNLNVEYSSYLNELFSVLFKNVISLIPAFAHVIAIALLSAIIQSAEGGIIGKTTAKVVKIACYSLIIAVITSMLIGIVSSSLECIGTIKRQIEIISPILITLTVLSGGGGSGAIYQPSAL
ncbi:MAG: hypothetical protein ACI4L9_04050, partial [Candidatus Coproplasma sp.]